MNKKGTLTSRTLDRLGLRFRSSSQPVDPDDLNLQKDGEHHRSTSVTTITRGELEIPEKYQEKHKRSLKEKLLGTKSGTAEGQRGKKSAKKKLSTGEKDPSSKSTFYVDDFNDDIMVTTATGGDDSSHIHEASTMQEKKKKIRPEGTFEYVVQDRETIEKIAAHFDVTPSAIKKANKLISSMIFAGQVLFIPDKDYVSTTTKSSSTSSQDDPTNQTISPFGSPQDRPTMDVPMMKSGNSSPTKIPGHVERQTPVSSPKQVMDFELVAPPHRLSEDEVQQLDQDCMERFIKLNVKHITDGQGVVKGVLLVTPNAVMFDPNVSDPLVVEHGPDRYGMIAPMDLIISAAMYHDIAAMKMRGKKLEDGTMFPKPEVYHDKTCPMAKEKLQSSQQSSMANSVIPENIRNILRNPLNKSDSVCSCGQGSMEGKGIGNKSFDLSQNADEFLLEKAEEFDLDDAFKPDLDVKKAESVSEKSEKDISEIETGSKDVDSDKTSLTTEDGAGQHESGAIKKSSPKVQRAGKLSVSFSIPESDNSCAMENVENNGENKAMNETAEKTEKSENGETGDASSASNELLIKIEEEFDKAVCTDDKKAEVDDQETRIGSIVYLPVEEDDNGEISLESLQATQNTLSQMSTSEFKEVSKSDPDLDDLTAKVDNREVEKTRSASTSSTGPFSPTPHLSAFVNYATGLFSRTGSDNSIKDVKDLIPDFLTSTDSKTSSASSTSSSTRAMDSKTTADLPVVSSAPVPKPGKRRGKISRHDNTGFVDVEVESAVTMDEKPDLMNMDYDKFAPRQSVAYPDPPLYLCLRLGTPQNKNVFHNYSIESYGRRRKKSEYWFSIPREKVDHLYAFFVQWTPEIYGDQEDLTAEKRGFVVIEEGEDGEDLEMLDEHFGPNSMFQKDWEIISKDEANKRRSIVFDEPIPLPDLIGESSILLEEHVASLSQIMPGRTVGYPWTLVYSTDKHGFSLKTLYRDMQDLESPILIVVKDTSDNVFGAMTSCELKISDSFYGTGETFLYTFYPEFQVFHWSGDNNFFMKGNAESLSIGASQGVFGLWFDGDLYHGRTNRCETFRNDLLTVTEDFVVKGFEAWAFIWD